MKINSEMSRYDRGFASLEAAGVLLIIIVVTMYGATRYNDYLDEKNWQLEALRITTWTGAARQYIGKNYAEIVKKKPSAGSPSCVTTKKLTTEGLLPSAFAEKNPEGQTLRACVVTLKNDNTRLEGMVISESGVALPLKAMLLTSRDIRQGYGGYIEKTGVATGAQKAWTTALASYGIQNGQPGHMAVLLSADDLTAAQSSSREDADRLYRYKTDGRPELNAMNTHIDMRGNNLNNAGSVNAATGNFSDNVNAQDVNATGSVNGQDGNFRGNVTANGDVSGQRGLFSGRLATSEYLQLGGIAWAGQSCSHDGLVGRDTKGGILSCQSGVWTTNSLGKLQTAIGNNACGAQSVSIATCPAGTRVISGGWKITRWSGDGVQNAPDASMPKSESTWYILTGGSMKGGQCLAAVVNCAL